MKRRRATESRRKSAEHSLSERLSEHVRSAIQAARLALIAVALMAAALLVAGASQARESVIRLQWLGPSSCQDDGSVAREIHRILGDSPIVAGEQAVFVTARVTQTPDSRWLVNLSTRSGALRGERTLVATSCTEVRRATALIVALMIDPDVRLAASEPDEAPESREAATPVRAEQPQAAREPAPSTPSTTTGLFLGLDALAAAGTLPGGSVGAGITLGVQLERLSLQISGAGWLARKKVSDNELEAGGRFNLYSANLLACYDLTADSPEFGGCLGAGGRRIRGEGFGVSDPGSAHGSWAALVTQWYASFPLSQRLSFRVALGTELPFRAPTFNLAGLGRVYAPSSAAAELDLALRLKF